MTEAVSKQSAAGTRDSTPVLNCTQRVYGPPGTGKTYHSTREVSEHTGTANNLTAVTYRRKMVPDLKESLEEAGVYPCEDGSDWPYTGTIHGVARRILDYDMCNCVADVGGRRGNRRSTDFAEEFFKEWWKGWTVPYEGDGGRLSIGGKKLGDLLLSLRTWIINTDNQKAPQEWHKWREYVSNNGSIKLFREFREDWEQFKEEKGLWDFDDLLIDAYEQGVTPPTDVMLVDEAQDNSPLMHKLLAGWAEDMDFVVVAGDGNQAIYRFMGAEPSLFFDKTVGEKEIFLDETYRIPKETWQYPKGILDYSEHEVPDLEFDSEEGEVGKSSWSNYQQLIKDAPPFEPVFHLVRCNHQIEDVAGVLIKAGVPFTAKGRYGWSWRDVRLYNALANIRKNELLTREQKLKLIDIFPSGEEMVKGVKKEWKNDLQRLHNTEWDKIFGEKIKEWVDTNYPLRHALSSSISKSRKKKVHNALSKLDGCPISGGEKGITHEISTIHGAKGREKDTVFLHDGLTSNIKNGARPYHRQPEEARVWYVGASRHRENLVVVDTPGSVDNPFLDWVGG